MAWTPKCNQCDDDLNSYYHTPQQVLRDAAAHVFRTSHSVRVENSEGEVLEMTLVVGKS